MPIRSVSNSSKNVAPAVTGAPSSSTTTTTTTASTDHKHHRIRRIAGILLGYVVIISALYNLDTSALTGGSSTGTVSGQRSVLRRFDHGAAGAVPLRKARVLWGIFTGDFEGDEVYRDNLRLIFSMDPVRVCSLDKFIANANYERSHCELIYTFVAGALKEGPTERLDDCELLSVSQPLYEPFTPDFGAKDMSLLNIKYVIWSDFAFAIMATSPLLCVQQREHGTWEEPNMAGPGSLLYGSL